MKIQYKYAVALTAALALFMVVLDSTIVNVAIVAMERDFKTTINSVQWVVTGYILAQAAVIPATGYFGNRFGIKRVFMIALTIFTISSLLCGLSREISSGPNGLNLLIAFRALQGIGGGMLFPLAASIAFGAFPPEERAASSAVIAVPVLFAPALGPTVGGLIVDSGIKWPGVFFINIPIGIIALILIARIVRPDEKAVTAPGTARAGFDYSGLVLSIVGVVLVVYSFVLVSQTKSGSITAANPSGVINGWGYWLVWVLLAAGVLLLALFAYLELFVVTDPVLDLRLFVTRDFRIASVVTWVVRGIVFGSFLLIPIFLQQYQGRSAVHTGLILMAQGIGAIIGIQAGSRLYDRIGPRALTVAGLIILTGATIWLIRIKPDSGTMFFVPILFLRGIGFGWSNLPLQTVAIGSITGRALPKANSLYNAAAQIFSSIGTALVTTILVQRTTLHASNIVQAATVASARPPANLALVAGTDAVSDVFKLLTFGTIAATIVALLLPRQSLKQQNANQTAPAPATPSTSANGIAEMPAFATATAHTPTGHGGYDPSPPAFAPSDAPDRPFSAARSQPFGPPPGTLDAAHAASASSGTLPDYDARIAALEQIIVHLMDDTQQPNSAPEARRVDEERIAALEQAVSNLDRLVHSLPPPNWHQEQYHRAGATEHRIAELERAVQHLTWGYPPQPSEGSHAPTFTDTPGED